MHPRDPRSIVFDGSVVLLRGGRRGIAEVPEQIETMAKVDFFCIRLLLLHADALICMNLLFVFIL